MYVNSIQKRNVIFQAYLKFSRFHAASCILEILGGWDTVSLSMLPKRPLVACETNILFTILRVFTIKSASGRFWYARKHRKIRAIGTYPNWRWKTGAQNVRILRWKLLTREQTTSKKMSISILVCFKKVRHSRAFRSIPVEAYQFLPSFLTLFSKAVRMQKKHVILEDFRN